MLDILSRILVICIAIICIPVAFIICVDEMFELSLMIGFADIIAFWIAIICLRLVTLRKPQKPIVILRKPNE